MILPIYLYGSQVLRGENQPVTPDYPELKELIANMHETMNHAEGVGLAAPQVGVPIRLFVVNADPMADEYPDGKGFVRAFINPEILETGGKPFAYREGCLSIPEIREEVVRDSVVKLRYLDEDFKEHTETLDGICARIIQHEYDHLEQVLFTDRLSQLKKKLLKRRLDSIRTGKKMPMYKARTK